MASRVVVRKATMADVPRIVALVNTYAQRGEVLPRKPAEVTLGIRDWVLAEADGQIVGCGALVVIWNELAEVRSLVVRPERRGLGLGARLLARLMGEARALGVTQVFTLTRAVEFFRKQGFAIDERRNFPRKIWKDCLNCPRFQNCDEVAMAVAVPDEVVSHAQLGA